MIEVTSFREVRVIARVIRRRQRGRRRLEFGHQAGRARSLLRLRRRQSLRSITRWETSRRFPWSSVRPRGYCPLRARARPPRGPRARFPDRHARALSRGSRAVRPYRDVRSRRAAPQPAGARDGGFLLRRRCVVVVGERERRQRVRLRGRGAPRASFAVAPRARARDARRARDGDPGGDTRPPSTGEAAIAAVARLERLKEPSVTLAKARRRAFRTLALRWHPDKFHAAHGSSLNADQTNAAQNAAPFVVEPGETHAEAVARRVRGIAQELNDAWKTGRTRS